jgi:Ca2+-binding EF-hand superfamily protein
MATLKEATRLTEELEELASRIHRELTDGQVDFTEMVRLADDLGESADSVASIFAAIDEALTQLLPGRGDDQEERAEDRSRRGGERGRDGSAQAEDVEDLTKDELLDRAREVGVEGRSSMTKEELAEAIRAAADPSKEELLERAREMGIEGRSSMTKEELREALEVEETISREELLDRAREADIPGRSQMSKEELREALRTG